MLLVTQREQAEVAPGDAHRVAALVLGVGGVLALVACGLALAWLIELRDTGPEELARRPLFVGYAGSAAGIAGTMAVVMALALTVVHRLVPRVKG